MRAKAVYLIERLEEGIYLVVAVLLAVAALLLLVSAGQSAVQELQGAQDPFSIVLTVLDKGLVLLMVAELLHTLRITVRERGLAAEPFLIVGLIAGIRRVLILTAQTDKSFQWNPDGIQLLILVGLILVMAIALGIWRRSERLGLEADTPQR
ncbi:MAG TPA: phosphate-starvation-inducible PsiE family protein [Candidatus Dormibacteraeota bacterium]|nr:phosphate-starvation-inducible PsiE family protein [Candidatus Dormibacteraeota bacterium]